MPLVHMHEVDGCFYERDCYNEYYHLIEDLIVNMHKQCVTVTGTPGIGKSLFYAYFFERFMKSHFERWIVVAATFEHTDRVTQFSIFENDIDNPTTEELFANDVVMAIEVNAIMIREKEQAEANGVEPRKMLFLCSGPSPAVWQQSVVFTSFNADWMRLSKTRSLCIDMPLWITEELQHAVHVLGFDLDDTIIAEMCDFWRCCTTVLSRC
ncbi:hypothetical protein PHMEG_0002033 [Phytophthora megakarya]|uniref:Uncharacterized protein n=1 Tax=Phytophthora megakarya TaxID=4795 RepID=A0A225WZN1_9STRA|nr:hypothetical protein PHMEG_0002033 [Phytophthora megakarya]